MGKFSRIPRTAFLRITCFTDVRFHKSTTMGGIFSLPRRGFFRHTKCHIVAKSSFFLKNVNFPDLDAGRRNNQAQKVKSYTMDVQAFFFRVYNLWFHGQSDNHGAHPGNSERSPRYPSSPRLCRHKRVGCQFTIQPPPSNFLKFNMRKPIGSVETAAGVFLSTRIPRSGTFGTIWIMALLYRWPGVGSDCHRASPASTSRNWIFNIEVLDGRFPGRLHEGDPE